MNNKEAEQFMEWVKARVPEPKREWVGLTLEERMNLGAGCDADIYYAIEAALKEKNGG
jgi:hypothetical protein